MRSLVPLLALLAACPPSTQEVDQPAASLDVILSVIDTTANPFDGKVAVVAQFSFNGDSVDLGGNATVACNGVPLTFSGIGYEGRVPLLAAGASYTFVHLRGGKSTSATVIAPPRPVLLSPMAGATVTRSSSLTLTYQAGSGSSVRASASDGTTAVGGDDEPDTGSYTGLNVTSLRAGAGTIGLTRDLPGTLQPTGFRSAHTELTTGSIDVAVIWN